MKLSPKFLFLLLSLFLFQAIYSQSISTESVEFQMLKAPKEAVDASARQMKATVTSPYNLTAEDVINKSKSDYQKALANYDNVVLESEKQFRQKLKDHDTEVVKAKEKFELESTEFKKYSMLERLTMTDQGKNPKLVLPNRPEYIKPQPPYYSEPNLNDYIIVNNDVLASQINIDGFTKEGNNLTILLDIKAVQFQDNAGQTFANQPTKLIVKLNGIEKINTSFFQEFKFVSSSPSNNINKPLEEKNHLNKVMAFVNQHLNDMFGYQAIKGIIKLESVKNKGKYDDLEKAHIYITTNLKKLQPSDPEISAIAMTNMQKGIDIWNQTLAKVEFKNPKADFNPKIAEFIYFNLIRLNVALNKKVEAEKYLNQLQENLVYLDLSSSKKTELDMLEKTIYKLK